MQLKVLGIVKDVTRARESTPQSPDNSQLLQPSGNFRFVPFAGTREAPTTARSNTLHTLKHTTCSHLSRSFETSSCSSCSSNSDAGVLGGQTREYCDASLTLPPPSTPPPLQTEGAVDAWGQGRNHERGRGAREVVVWGSRSEGEGDTEYGGRVASWSPPLELQVLQMQRTPLELHMQLSSDAGDEASASVAVGCALLLQQQQQQSCHSARSSERGGQATNGAAGRGEGEGEGEREEGGEEGGDDMSSSEKMKQLGGGEVVSDRWKGVSRSEGGGSSCGDKKQVAGAGEESLSSHQLQEYDLAVLAAASHTRQYEAQKTRILSAHTRQYTCEVCADSAAEAIEEVIIFSSLSSSSTSSSSPRLHPHPPSSHTIGCQQQQQQQQQKQRQQQTDAAAAAAVDANHIWRVRLY
jgi:hypothetical protein